MRVASWNVNSLRVRQDAVLDWIEAQRPDVLGLQETKLTDQEFPEDAFGDLSYDCVFTGQRAYNGVALISKPEMFDVVRALPGDPADLEPRLIGATVEGVRIYSVYVPNGQQVGAERYHHKLRWLARLKAFLEATATPRDPLIVMGDFNVAPSDADVYDADASRGQLLCSDAERAALRDLLSFGLVDAVAALDGGPKRFTWWDYRAGGWERNLGLRIDHLLVTRPLLERVTSVTICAEERGKPQPSDHVPVMLDLA